MSDYQRKSQWHGGKGSLRRKKEDEEKFKENYDKIDWSKKD